MADSKLLGPSISCKSWNKHCTSSMNPKILKVYHYVIIAFPEVNFPLTYRTELSQTESIFWNLLF